MMPNHSPLILAVCLALLAPAANGQYVPAKLPLKELPQEHDYQKVLREYLATLTEKDFALERKTFPVLDTKGDAEELYRLWLLTLNLPQVDAMIFPAEVFTLKAIEAEKGLALRASPHESQMLAWLAGWNSPGNPYHGSRPLKLRAFTLAVVDMVMLDYLYEHSPQGSDRSDFLGGNLIWMGYTLKTVKDVLPDGVRKEALTGLKKHVMRLNRWGPRGAMTDMDLFAPVGLWYCAQAIDDDETRRVAETYSKRLFTDEKFFHPAGYFVDVGCFDTSYNGISLYFATWAALASDWKFAKDAVDKAFRLRAHLCLPEPDGKKFEGPSHMSSRTSADPPRDQWNFPHRPYAAAMTTDEALHLAPLPKPEALKAAPARIAGHLNGILEKKREGKPHPWQEHHWSGAMNFAFEHYQKGYYTRRLKLEQDNTPLLKPLYLRGEKFVHTFDKAFLIARYDDHAVVIHTGPIKGWPNGLSGGALSAFWTPSTGPTLLGRRRGMQGAVVDSLADWRNWPVHAVSGLTSDGEFVTSALIPKPQTEYQVREGQATVEVSGTIPSKSLKEALQYTRRFEVQSKGVTIRSALNVKETVKWTELYESIPIFLHDGHAKEPKVKVQFQVENRWLKAEAKPQSNVKAVRVEREKGAILLTFTQPRTMQLSPKEWVDGFQTRATCRTLLVDLRDGAKVEYSISPVPR